LKNETVNLNYEYLSYQRNKYISSMPIKHHVQGHIPTTSQRNCIKRVNVDESFVIGAGNMASAFVKQLRFAQHEVSITTRDLAKAQALAARHEGAKAIALTDAAKDKDVIILATPYTESRQCLSTYWGT
jgi:ketol-acid reductoisomerase